MTNPGAIADLIGTALTTNTGPEDLAMYTGTVQSWDPTTGVNAIMVNGVILSNLRSLQGGIPVSYTPGDTVMLMRKQTQYFILGKVAAPGGLAGSAVASQRVATLSTVGPQGFGDIAGSFGPEVSVYIGSSRRCLVVHSCEIAVSQASGFQGVVVSGASSIAVETGVTDAFLGFNNSGNTYSISQSCTASCLVTAANGLRQGLNTFTCKYKVTTIGGGTGAGFNNRVLTVIPL